MRHAVIAIVLLSLGGSKAARAQHCHPPPPLAPRSLGLRVGLGAEAATYKTARHAGEYQGASLNVGWEHRWVMLRAALPVYRLVRDGETLTGLGDVLVDARVPFARTEGDTLVGGFRMAATLPSGSAARDLGMGHVMVMPGFFVGWQAHGAFVQTQLAYGRALAKGGHGAHGGGQGDHGDGHGDHGTGDTTHAGGPMPIVNPMNSSEVEAAVTVGYLLHEHLRVRGGMYGAIPVAAEGGASRGAVMLGGDLLFGPVDLGVEGHLPVAGDPFLAKAMVTAGVRF
ncbi:hypothetical protein [Chondromyces crocatus]|uniref:Transporter n=1 Tax=Chondromyces crocatus TaxID=52 RepID=A0A0K1EB27_CHOCO|nr:hypothetical protein [Chondromyces crocatus]AKT37897.1 uncharacterized protein CMC5_020400 [Chondromyces crocatus]